MNTFDVIIIGGGLGGLVAGAKLAKEGKRVFLLEQHYIPGGCATTFKRRDFVMEVGLHEMDGVMDKRNLKYQIFTELGVFDHVSFLKIPELYLLKDSRNDLVIPDDSDEAMRVLCEKFPHEKKGIKKFFKVINGIYDEAYRQPTERWKKTALGFFYPILFPYLTVATSALTYIAALTNPLFYLLRPNFVFWRHRNAGDFVDSIIKDNDLKMILLANIGYYHDDPYTMSLIYFSVAQAGYFKGGYFIKGGSQSLSDYLKSYIEQHGGEVLLGHEATNILMKNGKAAGVKFHKSHGAPSNPTTVFADAIISNAAIPLTAQMLPQEVRHRIEKKTKKLLPACSLLSIYIGFNKEVKSLGNKYYSTFVAGLQAKSLKDMIPNCNAPYDQRGFVFVDYSQLDAALAPKGKSVGVICCIDYLKNWENLNETDYLQKKEEAGRTFIARLEKIVPGISQYIEYYEVATPKTIQRYTSNPFGSPYGYAQIPKQAGICRIDNISPIKNLYYASAWTRPGGGFTGAILSGWFTASDVLAKLKKNTASVSTPSYKDKQQAKIISKTVHNDVIDLLISKPSDFDFKPGQYAAVTIEQPKEIYADKPLRLLSIVSHPDEKHLRFMMKTSHSSFKRNCKDLNVGDKVIIVGPMGDTILPNTEKPLVFLVGGIGITPVFSMMQELNKRKYQAPVLLIYSNKTKDTAIGLDYFERLALPHYKLINVFTAEGKKKRIDGHLLEKHIKNYNEHIYYIIGGQLFLESMKNILQQKGVSASNIKADNFG